MSRPKSKIRKHIQDDVKAKLQDKEVRSKTIYKCQGQNPRQANLRQHKGQNPR
jgi:hypothetical protein